MPYLRLSAPALALVLTLVLAAACGARAQPVPPPVCARPSVLDRLDLMLREAGRPMRLWPEPVGEVSTETRPIVHCAVRGQVLGYDTNRYGTQPVNETLVVHYTLELRHNGIFISLQ